MFGTALKEWQPVQGNRITMISHMYIKSPSTIHEFFIGLLIEWLFQNKCLTRLVEDLRSQCDASCNVSEQVPCMIYLLDATAEVGLSSVAKNAFTLGGKRFAGP